MTQNFALQYLKLRLALAHHSKHLQHLMLLVSVQQPIKILLYLIALKTHTNQFKMWEKSLPSIDLIKQSIYTQPK